MSKKSIHGVCVEIDGKGILLLGPSGSGKSDLALRLIDGGARLVADDQVALALEGGTIEPCIVASAPTEICGLLEIRGVGIVAVETVQISRLSLVVQLVTPDLIERLPEGASWNYLGVEIPMITLAPFEASAAAKLRLAVRAPNMNDGAMTDNSGPTHAE
ncbi:MAG: hypothetical protein HQ514_15650 [Rhodospirillales bacterium]|nr:hypothetical protein [Rhodospirillales bacterium]